MIRALVVALLVLALIVGMQMVIDAIDAIAQTSVSGFENEVLQHNCGPDEIDGPNVWAPDCALHKKLKGE